MTHERWLLDRAVALTEALMRERSRTSVRLVTLPPGGAGLLEIERAALVAALERSNWVQAHAAALLRISKRAMQYKVVKFKLYDEGVAMKRGHGGRPKGARVKPRTRGRDWRLQPWQ